MWKAIQRFLRERKLRRYIGHLQHIAEIRGVLDADEAYVRQQISALRKAGHA